MSPHLSFRSREPVEEQPPPSFLTELLFPLPALRRTPLGILTWWESRRLMYNVIVGACGLVSLTVITIADFVAKQQVGAQFGLPPLMLVFAYGILANVCYTVGPIIEGTLERVWKDRVLPVGPALFRQGLAFAVGLTLLPIPIVIVVEMARLAHFLFSLVVR